MTQVIAEYDRGEKLSQKGGIASLKNTLALIFIRMVCRIRVFVGMVGDRWWGIYDGGVYDGIEYRRLCVDAGDKLKAYWYQFIIKTMGVCQ